MMEESGCSSYCSPSRLPRSNAGLKRSRDSTSPFEAVHPSPTKRCRPASSLAVASSMKSIVDLAEVQEDDAGFCQSQEAASDVLRAMPLWISQLSKFIGRGAVQRWPLLVLDRSAAVSMGHELTLLLLAAGKRLIKPTVWGEEEEDLYEECRQWSDLTDALARCGLLQSPTPAEFDEMMAYATIQRQCGAAGDARNNPLQRLLL
mmetsp:Transcript_57751/g.137470  ORF Transcript_57751/g.137470 Transcript_57751/m.137470 type:complete len:204 (+) Transcript_57751:37-648(+)